MTWCEKRWPNDSIHGILGQESFGVRVIPWSNDSMSESANTAANESAANETAANENYSLYHAEKWTLSWEAAVQQLAIGPATLSQVPSAPCILAAPLPHTPATPASHCLDQLHSQHYHHLNTISVSSCTFATLQYPRASSSLHCSTLVTILAALLYPRASSSLHCSTLVHHPRCFTCALCVLVGVPNCPVYTNIPLAPLLLPSVASTVALSTSPALDAPPSKLH